MGGRGAGVNCGHHCGVRGERALRSLSLRTFKQGPAYEGREQYMHVLRAQRCFGRPRRGQEGDTASSLYAKGRGSGAEGIRELMVGELAHAFTL